MLSPENKNDNFSRGNLNFEFEFEFPAEKSGYTFSAPENKKLISIVYSWWLHVKKYLKNERNISKMMIKQIWQKVLKSDPSDVIQRNDICTHFCWSVFP